MSVTELIPLPGYQSSEPIDIAEIDGEGYIVGRSFEPPPPTWAPESHATLWAQRKVAYLSKSA